MLKLGLVGTNGSGKSSLCAYLSQKGFDVFSLSDIVRQESLLLGNGLDRDTLIKTGNNLKLSFGLDVLAVRSFEKAQASLGDVVFDSIRHPAESRFFLEKGVKLIGIDAPVDMRYQRIFARQAATDCVSFDTFKLQDALENEGLSSGQHIHQTLQDCHVIIHNTGSITDLFSEVEGFLADWMKT